MIYSSTLKVYCIGLKIGSSSALQLMTSASIGLFDFIVLFRSALVTAGTPPASL